MAQNVEPIEVVVISGPRKGEIIQLTEDSLAVLANDEIKALNQALDELIVAIEQVAAEVRATTAGIRKSAEAA